MKEYSLTMLLACAVLLLPACANNAPPVADAAPPIEPDQSISSPEQAAGSQPLQEETALQEFPQPEAQWQPVLLNSTDETVTVYWYKDMDGDIRTQLLAGDLEPQQSSLATCPPLEDFQEQPTFVVEGADGTQVMITRLELLGTGHREETALAFDTVAVHKDQEGYFLSAQAEYPDLPQGGEQELSSARYRYLPQVQRWIRQYHPQQSLFAVGLKEEQIARYFPNYQGGGDPYFTNAAVLCTQPVWLEDVQVKINWETLCIQETASGSSRLFSPDDVIALRVDHAYPDSHYFRYRDEGGTVHRQYVTDQHRDDNNGSITTTYLEDDSYFQVVEQ